MHNREASKRRMYGATKAGEVRHGIITPDGTVVMGYTDSELAAIRRRELDDMLAEREARKLRMRAMVKPTEYDSWAHKV
jgi:hypothetical protein